MDGISVQKGRRNQKPVKKPGFTALRKHFKGKYPKASEAMLWKLIKRDIRDNPFEHGDYTIEYRTDETDTKETSGFLVQVDEKNKEYPLKFEAFRKIKF